MEDRTYDMAGSATVDGLMKTLAFRKYKINLGIISGARIIDKKIIKLFKYGIINFHPGKIPETSGLDSFFWTIKKNIYPSVTAHFIDQYVDRGKILINSKSLSFEYIYNHKLKN